MTTSRTLGLILMIGGVVLCILIAAVGLTSAQTAGGRVLGVVFGALLGAPMVAVGAFILIRGQREAQELAVVEQQKKLLGMVRAQGRVNIAEAALELRVSRDTVREWVYDLVNKGLFTGYINWDPGRPHLGGRGPDADPTSVPTAAANWNWRARAWSAARTVGRRYSCSMSYGAGSIMRPATCDLRPVRI